jgi:hypothetical protein
VRGTVSCTVLVKSLQQSLKSQCMSPAVTSS